MSKIWQKYLDHAPEELMAKYRAMIKGADENSSWAEWQQIFLDWVDDYLDVELKKDVHENIGAHEAGGQFRVAFPHQFARGRQDVYDYLRATMEARKEYTDNNLYHGFPDCVEVHHEIETFLYFQNPMALYGFPGAEIAKGSILDVAEHTGSWVKDVPAWYDWKTSGYTSVYLGTRGVKDFPPYDYQEANHFRFLDEAIAAYTFTGEQRYMDLINDYCERWCKHIESLPAEGPIPCSILPEGAEFVEMGYSGDFKQSGKYQVFYNFVAQNTVYDVCVGLFNAYRLTKNARYLKAGEKMMNQMLLHSKNGRPAKLFADGDWRYEDEQHAKMLKRLGIEQDDGSNKMLYFTGNDSMPLLIMMHHWITGSNEYRDYIIKWAESIDESTNPLDQTPLALMAAAHYFTGDERYIQRAYQMALRMYPLSEDEDEFHQCNHFKRQGNKNTAQVLYTAMFGDPDFCTRGALPTGMFRYKTDGQTKLPEGVSVRVWQGENGRHCFEAVNTSGKDAEFAITLADGAPAHVTIDGLTAKSISIAPGASVKGEMD